MIGYIDKNSFKFNDEVKIFVHSEINYKITIFPVFDKNNILIEKQMNSQLQNLNVTCDVNNNWNLSFSFKIDEQFTEKIYIIHIKNIDNDNFYIPFYIISSNKTKNLVVSNTNTWAAYNNAGGGSFYNILKDSTLR